mmetsp:Transcript_6343/g.13112  ORF Transcript_6343/g.13112 Transcript_6343/m.13112 type:complete len:83 (+) Transcript_6343:378-626(+)
MISIASLMLMTYSMLVKSDNYNANDLSSHASRVRNPWLEQYHLSTRFSVHRKFYTFIAVAIKQAIHMILYDDELQPIQKVII